MLTLSPDYAQVHWNNLVAAALDFAPGLGDLMRGWAAGDSEPRLKPAPPLPWGRRGAPPAMPADARYLSRTFLSRWGARDYRLYVPAALPRGPQGLVLMLHGCTQHADDFARGTGMNRIAERHGLVVAYPNQARAYNLKACWNWFRPSDQRRDAGEPALLAGLARALVAEYGIDPARVFAAGLSAGGAMAAVLAAAYPDVFAAVGVHSGLPYRAANDVASAYAAMRGETARGGPSRPVRTIVFHGSDDAIVHRSNARRVIRAATGAAASQRTEHGTRGGRKYRRTVALRSGIPHSELWLLQGAGHAWSGGLLAGSCTDPLGPDASAEMVRFFLEGRPQAH